MATIVSVHLFLAAKVVSDTNINGVSANTLLRNHPVTPGQAVATISSAAVGYDRLDSNIRKVVASFAITVAYKLTTGQAESVYTTDDMLDDLEELMDPEFYRVTGVADVIGVPELDLPKRIGRVIEYTVTMQVSISP
jgi:hypothetical protein